MYNTRNLPVNEILCAFGDTDNFRLEQLIEPEYSEDELNVLKPSGYYSIETLPIQLKNRNNFNVLSLNAQSINAKFDCLLALIEVAKHQGISFQAICIQESWTRFQKRSTRDRLRYDPMILIGRSHSTNADHDRLMRSTKYEAKQFIANWIMT